jgi:hypothetical protein
MKNAPRLPWLKLWHEARSDLKLRSLTDAQFRVWFSLLCFASEQPERGTILADDLGLLALEVSGGDIPLLDETLSRLVSLRIVTLVTQNVTCDERRHIAVTFSSPKVTDRVTAVRHAVTRICFVNFEKRNEDVTAVGPMTGAERMRKYRDRMKKQPSVASDVTEVTACVTRPLHVSTDAIVTASDGRSSHVRAEGEGEGELNPPPPTPSIVPAPPPASAPGRMSSGIVNGHPAREGTTPTRSGRPPASSAEEAEALLAWAAAQLGDRLALEDFGPKIAAYARDYPAGWVEQAILLARANARPGGLDQYVNKLLLKWHAQGRTDADALAARDAGRGSAALPPPAPAAPPDFYARLKPPARRRPASAPGPGPIAEDG